MTNLERAELILKEYESMREAQKRYFKYRDPNRLQAAKELERKVDKMVARYWEVRREEEQPKLF